MAANTRQMLSDSHADVTLSPRHAGRAGEAGTRSSKVLADCGWLSQRCAVLALLVIASVVSWIGCIYFLFIVAPVNPLSGPGYMVLAPVNTMLLLLYWRGWDGVRNLVIIVNSVVIGAILPLPSEQFEYLPQAIVIPTALAMVLSSPRWVIGSSVGTIAVLLVRAGGATGPLGLPHVLAYGVTISCLVLSRLVIDAARREAEARADQAEQARAESERQAEKLRKQQASLHFQATLLGAVEQPVLATDPEGRMTYWNPAASQLFGWSEDAVLGRRFVEIEPPLYDLQTDDAWWEAHAWHGPSTREYAAQRRDGSTFPTLVSAWPIHDVDGTVLGQIAVISDLTERREVERQRELFEAGQKLRALGQMAGGIAHDLNQALAVVTGYVELALDGLPAAPNGTETRAYLDTAAQAAVQGATSIKRLLTFARQQDQGPPEIIDVGQTVEETVRFTAPQWRDRSQAEGRPILLDVQAEPNLRVRGWVTSLREALMNLVLNAVDALPQGGAIRITVRRDAGAIVIEVADTGTGMVPEVQARIFEPFYTTKGENGTGLGLAMVFGIVERHGGQIAVSSAVGTGTTFSLRFPEEITPLTVPQHGNVVQVARPSRILVVDDEPQIVQLLAILLMRDRHQVDTALSGEAAVDLLEAKTYDLVISDLGMGPGMNGWQLAAQINAQWPETQFVLASGWGAGIGEQEAQHHKVSAVLAKPYRLAAVRNLIGQLLASGPIASGPTSPDTRATTDSSNELSP